MENPYARMTGSVRTSDYLGREKILETYSPQSWEITYQVSIWTDSYKQRDDIMSKILIMFRHDLTIPYYPDPVNDPNKVLWMELRMDESFNDDTNLEDLQEKESRKFIRTSFTVNSRAILLYDSNFVSTILRIEIENELLAKQGKKITFSLETVNGEEIVILS